MSVPMLSRIAELPRLDVKMMIAFLKLVVDIEGSARGGKERAKGKYMHAQSLG